ncbi:variant erythrocyte surface antigen alpha subunit, putative [Babesia ovis]|uniref:Variant erythrocyte surface antigen alpha subunit, putative n=1 Tax=Babesia ovis TaxID=5869 RepID=A0A9W5TE82_BABOV|nr:variant erythrocyte surface antigen alpha subunit, putative [Babesia ovis]
MSVTESYYLLQDCLVALYYQLYFLKQQCNWKRQDTSGDGFGWAFCRYGADVNGDRCVSWICPQAKAATKNEGTKYNQVLENHTKACGQQSSASPLQAFLTDCLPGFTCRELLEGGTTNKKEYDKCYMEFLEHRGHCPPGQYCPIPMGFSGSFRKGSGSSTAAAGMSGLALNAITANYANDDLTDSCLYQITRCISSLTRRVPRSTGTLYGFFYSIGGICKKDGGRSKGGQAVNEALSKEFLCCPGWRDPQCLLGAVGNMRSGGKECASFYGLTDCGDNGTPPGSSTCGKYLHPLTGSLYNSVAPQFVDTYISWMVYLSYKLHEGLQRLLEEFKKIQCTKENGCTGKGGQGSCETKGCKKTTHGTVECCCDNIVKCAGVYGLFYRYGFSFLSPVTLTGNETGASDGSGSGKRNCQNFYTQLEKVIKGTPFRDLFTQIRKFIYTTRLPFGLYVTAFWLIVLLYLLWSMTYNLDLLHLRSHWRSPRSYLVPLQRILADGSRKGFCTLGYFQEANGDRLLSQGVSDVYL